MFRRTSTVSRLGEEIIDGLDEALEALRWCRKHVEERQTRDSLRLVKADLSALTTALDAEMQGEYGRGREAIDRMHTRAAWDPYDPFMPQGC